MVNCLLIGAPVPEKAYTRIVNVPVLSSVPASRPVSSSSRPGGILPAIASSAVAASFPVTGIRAEYCLSRRPIGRTLPLVKSSRGTIVTVQGTDAVAPVESVTVSVNAYRPAVVPVPLTFPLAGSTVMAGGSSPSAPNVYGERPPTAFTPVRSGWSTSRLAVRPVSGGVLFVSVWIPSGASTNSERSFVALVPVAFARTLIGKVPLCVGVPPMTPFVPRFRPAGSVPPASVHDVTVAPVAVRPGAVYGWLMFASGNDAVVTETVGGGGGGGAAGAGGGGGGAVPGFTSMTNESSDGFLNGQVANLS